MTSSEDTPKAVSSATFTSSTDRSSTSKEEKRNFVKKGDRRRSIRTRPSTRHGLPASNPSPAVPSASAPTDDQRRRQRSKALTQALRRSRDMRLASKINSAPRSGPPKSPLPAVPRLGQARNTTLNDDEDEDWAAFVSSGYKQFPMPPSHNSPARTNMSLSSAYSASSLSPLTTASSLPSSSLPKTGIDWLDDELAWASSDEEGEHLKVVFRQPFVNHKETHKSNKRLSSSSDVFCTPESSPQIGYHPQETSTMPSARRSSISPSAARLTEKEEDRMVALRQAAAVIPPKSVAPLARQDIVDRHGSVSSAASSGESSAMSSVTTSSCADSVSTRASSVDYNSYLESSKREQHYVQPTLLVRPAAAKSKKLAPSPPQRKASLDLLDRMHHHTLLGSWLADKERIASMPRVEATPSKERTSCFWNDDDEEAKEFDECDDASSSVPPSVVRQAMRFTSSSTDLLSILSSEKDRRHRKSSRSSILANCQEAAARLSREGSQTSLGFVQSSSRSPSLSMSPLPPSQPVIKPIEKAAAATSVSNTAAKLRDRLAVVKTNLLNDHRVSMPDVPVTPSTADSAVAVHMRQKEGGFSSSPSQSVFGRAAINARASLYASAAAAGVGAGRRNSSSSSVSPMSPYSSANSRGVVSQAGFCFDYDPDSPFYVSTFEDYDIAAPPKGKLASSQRAPPPSSFWRRNNAKAHEAAVDQLEEDPSPTSSKFPSLRRRGSFRLFKDSLLK